MTDLWNTLQHKLNSKQVASKFATLKHFAEVSFPIDGKFPLTWLSAVLVKIDELWYHNLMLPLLTKTYGGLELQVDEKEKILCKSRNKWECQSSSQKQYKNSTEDPRVAGYVLETVDGSKITLYMNRHLFANLFKKQEFGYHSGGLLCKERLVCFLHVLLHETVHLILTMLDRIGFRTDVRDHGKDFNKIIRNLFEQTDSQHGLIDGYEQYHDLQTIRKNIKVGDKIDIFVNGQWVPGIVEKTGYKWVNVKCKASSSLHKITFYRVHAGLVRLPK